MTFESIVPILYSSDVKKSIAYYMEQLAFDEQWTWDEPTTFGGVSKDCVRLFFCLKSPGSPGTWVAINVDDVDAYCEIIKTKGANILALPESKPWFMREMLVADPDGHIIRFGHSIE
ncbi:hypothetical protein BH11BAC6_BH11BAC6_08880 [soil metagenome]